MYRSKLALLLFSLLLLTLPRPCFSWGAEGHAAIVRLAFQLMPSTQRERLYKILHTTDPWKIGTWADRGGRKKYPESEPWHFVDIPKDATQYVASDDCKNGCLISELTLLEKELKTQSLSKKKRREDMLFYLHFFSDLYQPFHNLGPDGANAIRVKFHGENKSLHWIWDDGIIMDHDLDTVALLHFARTLQSEPLDTDITKIAMENHDIAVANLVDSDTRLPSNYTETHWPIVEHALVMAALEIVARTKDM